jgi:hypothetical protein
LHGHIRSENAELPLVPTCILVRPLLSPEYEICGVKRTATVLQLLRSARLASVRLLLRFGNFRLIFTMENGKKRRRMCGSIITLLSNDGTR